MKHIRKRNWAASLAAKGRNLLVMAIAVLSVFTTSAFAGKKPEGRIIGPTGLVGIYQPGWPKRPTEIQVTSIEKDSPAEASGIKPGDLIIGFENEAFKRHPLWDMADAIEAAEASGGKLTLLLKSGKKAHIQLAPLGAYSPTAPYNCPKTDKIVTQAAEGLLKTKNWAGTPTRTGLLGLLATGEKKYIDLVGKAIHESDILKIDPQRVDAYLSGSGAHEFGYNGWLWGYNMIVLGEYYLLTKDEKVLPALRTYANGSARSQDGGVGYWGHRSARGSTQRAPGYGTMSQPTLSNFLGLLIAQKCGIKDPVVDQAVERTYATVSDIVGRGGFSYGSGGVYSQMFNNNGTSGSAAICMSLKGNKNGTAYFSQCAATSYDNMSSGHGSNFFNPLWTPPGASLSGPEVTHQFFLKGQWYFAMERHWKNGFPGTGRGGLIAGQALLTYCLPRKALLITGREADPSIYVRGDEATKVIMRSKLVDSSKSLDELLPLLGHSFVQVRMMVLKELRVRTDAAQKKKNDPEKLKEIVTRVMAKIKDPNELTRCSVLAYLGSCPEDVADDYVDQVGSILRNQKEPFKVRVAAAQAFSNRNLNNFVGPYFNDILRLVVEPRTEPDPFGRVDSDLANVFMHIRNINKINALEMEGIDKKLLYQAVNKFMAHPRQNARERGGSLAVGIPLEDFHFIGDQLRYVLEAKDPRYHTYSRPVNPVALQIVSQLQIKEGLDYIMNSLAPGGKASFKWNGMKSALPLYGGNAEPYIEKIEKIREFKDKFTKGDWKNILKKIREDENPRKMISLEEAMKAGKRE